MFTAFSFAWLLMAGCGEGDDTIASRSRRNAMYDPGTPRFEFEAAADIRDGKPAARCDFEILTSSLVFVKSGAGLIARFEIRLRVAGDPGGRPLAEISWQEEVKKETLSTELIRIADRWIEGPAEVISVEAMIEDLASSRTAQRVQRVELFAATDTMPRILRPVLRAQRGTSEVPVLAPQVPVGLPGLHISCTFRNADRLPPGVCEAFLLRFPIDTLAASPPYFLNSLPSTLRRQGIEPRNPDTLWRRELHPGRAPLHIEQLRLDGLVNGVYRILIRVSGSDIEASRLIVCVDRDFPKCVRIRQMAEAMTYILPRARFEDLIAEQRDDSLTARFERIWLEFGGNPDGARNLIRTFAERIEQANLSFSTFKEGWKSDPGMVVILFGPPSTVTREFRKERWSYPSGLQFLFEQVTTPVGDATVENWALYRDAGYESYWEKEVDRWRNGRVF